MIYFIRNTRTGDVKIGLSDEPDRRLAAMQVANSDPLVLMGCVAGDRRIEAALHHRFHAFHIRGEWFRGEPLLMDFVRTTAFPFTVVASRSVQRSTSIGRIVSEELEDRDQCRHGLQGVRMRHLPTGREFDCGGSKWDARGGLLLYTRSARARPGKSPKSGPLPIYTLKELGEVFEPYSPDEIVRADECILLSPWPVVCCQPRRHPTRA